MGPIPLIARTKHLIYVCVLPIYLWSIGYKTLEEYISQIEADYELYRVAATEI